MQCSDLHNFNIFQLNGRRLPLELKLLVQVQIVPGVIRLVDFYEHNDSFIYVMESPSPYKDLFDIISKKGMLEEPLARHFFRQVMETVIACHSQGVIHGGIRDSNLLVRRCLKVQPSDRPTLEDLLNHPWMSANLNHLIDLSYQSEYFRCRQNLLITRLYHNI